MMRENKEPVALITGGSVRVGKAISSFLHEKGYRVCLHYRYSHEAAKSFARSLNEKRLDSALCFFADLCQVGEVRALAKQAIEAWGRLDLLINNASSFYATPVQTATEQAWDDLMGSNVKGAFFLSEAVASELKERQGSIINITDIHGEIPLKNHSIYSMSKAALHMMTKALAKELAPAVRVNAIAPGSVLWPQDATPAHREKILKRTALQREGSPEDVVKAVEYLLKADFVTGQCLKVDGGRYL